MSLAKKLQLKDDAKVRLVGTPQGLDLGDLPTTTAKGAPAILVFVQDSAALKDRQDALLEAARKDDLAWIAYPKAGQLGTDLNRDILWQLLDGQGVRPVRQVSLDDVWSALRFRPA